MKIVKASAEIIAATLQIEQLLELAGRVCYKSEDRITEDSASSFIARMLDSKHESVLEHAAITVRFICDRGVSHELVRHRLASFSQESTRYVNYSKGKFGSEITVIEPCFWPSNSHEYNIWKQACEHAEMVYMSLVNSQSTPQEARSVLPNSLKTEIIVTANPREWRHIFKLRCSKQAHPQMREIMLPLLDEFNKSWPSLFADIVVILNKENKDGN